MDIILTASAGFENYSFFSLRSDSLNNTEFVRLINNSDSELYSKNIENDIVYHDYRLDSMLDIKNCALPLLVTSYSTTAECNNEPLYNFWNNNYVAMANIDRQSTYDFVINEVENCIHNNTEDEECNCIKNIGLIWCTYFVDNMYSAKNLSNIWKQRYYDSKNKLLDMDDVKKQLESIKTKHFCEYFKCLAPNTRLHNEYKKIIENILMEDN